MAAKTERAKKSDLTFSEINILIDLLDAEIRGEISDSWAQSAKVSELVDLRDKLDMMRRKSEELL